MLAGGGAIAITSGRGSGAAISDALPTLALQALISAIVAPMVFSLMSGTMRMVGLRPARPDRE